MFYYSFFVHFQKILTEINFVSLLFLKLKQNKNMKTILLKVFIYKRENALFQGSTIFCFFIFWGFYFKKNKRTNVTLARLRLKFYPHNSRKL